MISLIFFESSEDELGPVDEFKNSNKRFKKFEETLIPKSENHNTFPDATFHVLRFNITQRAISVRMIFWMTLKISSIKLT